MALITNTEEFCQNYLPSDQKSIEKLSILSFFNLKVSTRGFLTVLITIW